MGNSCSDSYCNKHKPQAKEIHIQDFHKTYKALKLSRAFTFTHDSKISRIKDRATGDVFIVKRVTFSNEYDLYAFLKELEYIAKIEHDNLLKIYNYSVEKNQLKDLTVSYTINIVFENFDYTLQDELIFRSKNQKQFSTNEITKLISTLADVLEYLQLKNYSHCNIKPSNIYITPDRRAKLMFVGSVFDCSEAKEIARDLASVGYMAPRVKKDLSETLLAKKFNTATTNAGTPRIRSISTGKNEYKYDVFSLGLVVLEMMSMRSVTGLNAENCEGIRHYRVFQCEKQHGSALGNLVESMLKENEMLRPDFMDLKRMVIMEEYNSYVSGKKVHTALDRNREKREHKGTIELKVIKNSSEVQFKHGYFDIEDESDLTELSLLEEISINKSGKQHEKLSSASSLGELSPTKAFTDLNKNGSSGKTSRGSEAAELLSEFQVNKEGISPEGEEAWVESEEELGQIKVTTTLRRLIINLEEKQCSKEVAALISHVISAQEELTDLVLVLPRTGLGDDGLMAICTGLEKTNKLALCHFDLRKNKISDEGAMKLFACLGEKKSLINLRVNLSENKVKEGGCKEIVRAFEKLENLKALTLSLGRNSIGKSGLMVLGSGLSKLKEIESLVMYLHRNEIEGKEGLIELFNGLGELAKTEKLKKLRLDLSNNLLGDEDMESVIEFITKTGTEEVALELKDNCISEEVRLIIEEITQDKRNVRVKF